MKPITLEQAIKNVADQRALLLGTKALLVVISGIDGSGKGYLWTSKDTIVNMKMM